MKKRNLLTLALVALLAFTLGIGGTLAYFTKTYTSNDNLVRAAKFEVDSNGTLDQVVEFDLTDEPLYPGIERELYEFEIDKKGTEVDVKYEIRVEGLDDLFIPIDGVDSPAKLFLYRNVNDVWTKLDNLELELIPKINIEKFKIGVEWEHDDINDVKFQGKAGKVGINVVASQIDKEAENPVDPDLADVAEAKASIIAMGDEGLILENVSGNQPVLKRPFKYHANNSLVSFYPSFIHEDGTKHTVSTVSDPDGTGIYTIKMGRENVDCTVIVKLQIQKGEAIENVNYEVSVPKAVTRPIGGGPVGSPEPITVRLLP